MSNPLRQHISKQLAARQLQLVPANSNMCDLTVACLQFLGNLPVNEFWKSVYSCRSYDQKLHVVFLQKNVWPKCQCDKWHSHRCSHKFLSRGSKQHRLFTMTQEWNQYIKTYSLWKLLSHDTMSHYTFTPSMTTTLTICAQRDYSPLLLNSHHTFTPSMTTRTICASCHPTNSVKALKAQSLSVLSVNKFGAKMLTVG